MNSSLKKEGCSLKTLSNSTFTFAFISTFQDWHIKGTIVGPRMAILSSWKFNLGSDFPELPFTLRAHCHKSHLHFRGNTFFWAIQMQNMKCNLISEREGNAVQTKLCFKEIRKIKKENMFQGLDEIVFVWDICASWKAINPSLARKQMCCFKSRTF